MLYDHPKDESHRVLSGNVWTRRWPEAQRPGIHDAIHVSTCLYMVHWCLLACYGLLRLAGACFQGQARILCTCRQVCTRVEARSCRDCMNVCEYLTKIIRFMKQYAQYASVFYALESLEYLFLRPGRKQVCESCEGMLLTHLQQGLLADNTSNIAEYLAKLSNTER